METILSRMLSHFRRDFLKVIEDIELQLALLRRKLILYERQEEAAMVEQAQHSAVVKNTERLHRQLCALLEHFGITGEKVKIPSRFPLELEPLLHHIYRLGEELSQYSVDSLVKKSESELEEAFNELKRDLQQARRTGHGEILTAMVNQLLDELTEFEDFLLEETFSKHDEPRIVQQCVALARKINELELLIEKHFPLLDDARQRIVLHWNQIVEALIEAFDRVYAGKTVPIKMRSGVKEFAVEGI